MGLSRTASLDEVFSYLESKQFCVLLFIDQSKPCLEYLKYNWVQQEADPIEVDQEILETFQIGKVPQFRFFVKGSEIANLVGTVPAEDFQKLKNNLLKKGVV